MKCRDFLQKIGVSATLRDGLVLWVALAILVPVGSVGCPEDEPTYEALNGDEDCVVVHVADPADESEGDAADDDSAGDDDDSAGDGDIVRTELTCCGGDTVIGEGLINPSSAVPGQTRYAAVTIDRDAFEASGGDLDQVTRVTVSFDARGVGEGEAELKQDGLQVTLWDGSLGCGELGGVPRDDTLCFHLWADAESEDEE